jgi:hypothetical protein
MKASCDYLMEEIIYNVSCFGKHVPYDQFLCMANNAKLGVDRLDGVSHLKVDKTPMKIFTEAGWATAVPHCWKCSQLGCE